MKQMEPQFSIIVPVYNGEKVVERCIQSVINMDYCNWELIIINDGSVDSTEAICNKYLPSDQIKLINQVNKGVSNARNHGIKEASGEYILFMDADDYMDASICRVFNENMAYSDFGLAEIILCYSKKKSHVYTKRRAQSYTYLMEELEKVFTDLYRNKFINSPCAKCYRRVLITEMFDESISLGEDLLFNLNYLNNCKNFTVIQEPVYFYEIQESGSLSSSLVKKGFETLFKVYNETLRNLESLNCLNMQILNSIQEKYVVDFINMIERNIRFNPDFNRGKNVEYIIMEYNLIPIFQKVILKKYGLKWELERKFLFRQNYKIFILLTSLLYKGGKLKQKLGR